MITLQRVGDVIKFTFQDNPLYLNNGTIEVPVNSLSLLIDESDIATFKKNNGDAFLSCPLTELGMTKEQLIQWYKDNAVDEGMTPEEVEDIVESATTNLFGYAEYDSNSQRINFKHDASGSVISYIDASDFVIDGMIDNVEIVTVQGVKYLKITFNTESGKEPILIPLSDIFNPSDYYTKTEVDNALSGKLDTDVFDEKERVIAASLTDLDERKADTSAVTEAISVAVSGKQDTLVSGTNIKTINNTSILGSGNIDIQGGGKAVSGGTNISITTGETTDTINCTLPIREGSNSNGKGIIVGDSDCTANGKYAISLGHSSDAYGDYSFCHGSNSQANGQMAFAYGGGCYANHAYVFMFGGDNTSTKNFQFSYGRKVKPKNELEFGFGTYNNSSSASTVFGHSGNTMFSIGNGYDFSSTHNWHNAFEVRQNGDIYVPNTNDTSVTGDYAYSLYPMVRLQDTITATAANTTALGGLKLVKLTQAAYDAMEQAGTLDSSTLYVVTDN